MGLASTPKSYIKSAACSMPASRHELFRLAGLGLAYLPEDLVQDHVAAGRLVRVLANWSPLITGYHLYYPNRQPSPAFAFLVEALRYRS